MVRKERKARKKESRRAVRRKISAPKSSRETRLRSVESTSLPTHQDVTIKFGESGGKDKKDNSQKPYSWSSQTHSEIKGLVHNKIDEFKRSFNKSGAEPAVVRKKDEHVGFNQLKKDIEKKLHGQTDSKAYRSAGFSQQTDKLNIIDSGIRGLNEIVGGGLPENSLILLSGTCGTGKSIFGMNFLMEGAMKGEPGIYISLEESPESNVKQMKLFGWPVDQMLKDKKLMVLQPELYNFDALLTTIEDSVDRIGAKRLVIDSISILGMYFEDPYRVRKSLLDLGALLKKLNCTTIAIDEIKEGDSNLSAYGVEEFVVDGVIVLYLIKRSNIYIRAAVIRKMRGVGHSTKIHPMEIKSPGGITIYPSQELFEEIG